jgi:hypothetical protein
MFSSMNCRNRRWWFPSVYFCGFVFVSSSILPWQSRANCCLLICLYNCCSIWFCWPCHSDFCLCLGWKLEFWKSQSILFTNRFGFDLCSKTSKFLSRMIVFSQCSPHDGTHSWDIDTSFHVGISCLFDDIYFCGFKGTLFSELLKRTEKHQAYFVLIFVTVDV